MIIVAERINSSRKPIARAIEKKDTAMIQNEAKAQEQCGAGYIDVNAGTFIGTEKDMLKWLIEIVQEAVEIPLCLDSADPEVLKAVIGEVDKTPMLNSITLEPKRLEGILPLAVKHNAALIALCQSETGMANTANEKIEMADQLVGQASRAGLPLENLYIDPLVFPVATDSESASATLEAIRAIKKRHPLVKTICGLTNVSYGLPNRRLINRTFLVSAIGSGLSSAILDPTDNELRTALTTALMIAGKDQYCMDYIRAHKSGELS